MKAWLRISFLTVFAALALAAGSPAWAGPTNLIVNGTFASGNTGFTSAYTYATTTNGGMGPGGTYYIGSEPCLAPSAYSDWGCFTGPTGSGNMLIANGASNGEEVWGENIAVTANTAYTFSFWGAEVDADSGSVPDLVLTINGHLTSLNAVFPEFNPSNGGAWEQFSVTWNSGSNTTAALDLSDANTQFDFNDFAITDLSFSANSSTAPTPEPGTLMLLASGVIGIGAFIRRRLACRFTPQTVRFAAGLRT